MRQRYLLISHKVTEVYVNEAPLDFLKLMSLEHIASQFNLPDFTFYLLQILPFLPKSQKCFLSFSTLNSCCGKEKLISSTLHNL